MKLSFPWPFSNVMRLRVLALLLCFSLAACGGGGNDETPLVGASPAPVENAGLVLVHPFLRYVFSVNGYTEGEQFKDRDHQERAVQLLHYAATGFFADSDESLTVAKVLCGLTPDDPIASWQQLSKEEIAVVDNMLQALIQAWPEIKNSSRESVRKVFISRSGVLYDRGDHWEILVEPNVYDVLLRGVPFSFSRIQFSWMKKPILTQWQ